MLSIAHVRQISAFQVKIVCRWQNDDRQEDGAKHKKWNIVDICNENMETKSTKIENRSYDN